MYNLSLFSIFFLCFSGQCDQAHSKCSEFELSEKAGLQGLVLDFSKHWPHFSKCWLLLQTCSHRPAEAEPGTRLPPPALFAEAGVLQPPSPKPLSRHNWVMVQCHSPFGCIGPGVSRTRGRYGWQTFNPDGHSIHLTTQVSFHPWVICINQSSHPWWLWMVSNSEHVADRKSGVGIPSRKEKEDLETMQVLSGPCKGGKERRLANPLGHRCAEALAPSLSPTDHVQTQCYSCLTADFLHHLPPPRTDSPRHLTPSCKVLYLSHSSRKKRMIWSNISHPTVQSACLCSSGGVIWPWAMYLSPGHTDFWWAPSCHEPQPNPGIRNLSLKHIRTAQLGQNSVSACSRCEESRLALWPPITLSGEKRQAYGKYQQMLQDRQHPMPKCLGELDWVTHAVFSHSMTTCFSL